AAGKEAVPNAPERRAPPMTGRMTVRVKTAISWDWQWFPPPDSAACSNLGRQANRRTSDPMSVDRGWRLPRGHSAADIAGELASSLARERRRYCRDRAPLGGASAEPG